MPHRRPHRTVVLVRTLAATLVAAILLPAATPAAAQTADRRELVAALDSATRAHAADSTVAGVSVAVVRRGDTLVLEGYGLADLEFDVATPADAVYEIGSVTKQFTAAAVLRLAEDDSLDLDADIAEYLPDFDTRGHRVPVRRLLNHTSGIRSYTSLSAFWADIATEDLSRDTVVSLIEAEPFDFEPGSALIYNNSAYFLLGLIIEEVSGRPYGEYVAEHLFGPAGMDDSYYCDERAVVEHRAHGYAWSGSRGLLRKSYLDHTWPFSAGSLCSTAGDLVAWNRALHGGDLLEPESYRAMTTPARLDDGTELRYGMGLSIHDARGHRVVEHGGGINGFLSRASYYPADDLVVVVLQNSTGPRGPGALADSLARLVLGPGEEPGAGRYAGDLAPFTGRYSGPARGRLLTLRVDADSAGLSARPDGRDAEPSRLEHLSGLTWRDGPDRYTFVRAGDRLVELRLDQIGGHYVLRRLGGR